MTSSPYCLSPAGSSRGDLAHDLAALADRALAAAEPLSQWLDLLDGPEVLDAAPGAPLAPEERVVEALTLGVLWRARGGPARRTGLGRAWRALRGTGGSVRPPAADLRALGALLSSLLATGEYGEEVRRLERWEVALRGDPALARDVLEEVLALAARFETAAAEALGPYTAGVEPFRSTRLPVLPAADRAQTDRTAAEYHLALVGAELLNRAWRAPFAAARRRVVIAPSCLRLLPEGRCEAVRDGARLFCQDCSPACMLAEVQAVAEAAGAELVTIEHGADLGPVLARLPRDGGTGVVGIACAPSLLSGGFAVRAAGLPAQCVILEASGCARWLPRAEPTALDLSALARILDVRAEQAALSARSAAAAPRGTGRCPRSPLPAAAPGSAATIAR